MSTMPRLGHSSFGESFSTSQKSTPKTPSFISRDNTSSPDDWLNTDDVATRGNISDEEQVSQFFAPLFQSYAFVTFKARGRFHKAKTPKFVLQNAKIFVAFSLFNFIKALTPKLSQQNAKK